MKQVLVNVPLNDSQKERFKAISDELEFIFKGEEKDSRDVSVIIGNISVTRLKEFEKLEWLQTSAVGVDKYIKKGVLKEDTILTNAVDVHTKEVAEHCLAMLL